MVDHQPLAVPALERVGGEECGHRDLAPRVGEDVLAAGEPGEVALHVHVDVADAEAHLVAVPEDGLPGLAHRVPAREQAPAGVDAADVIAVRPDRDPSARCRGSRPRGRSARWRSSTSATSSSGLSPDMSRPGPRRREGRTSGSSRAPGQGPSAQMPVSGAKTAPWVAQTRKRPSSVRNSLGHSRAACRRAGSG